MSPEFEKFLMEKINLVFKVVKWLFILYFIAILPLILNSCGIFI